MEYNTNETIKQSNNMSSPFWYGFKRFIPFLIIVTIIGALLGTALAFMFSKKTYTAKCDGMLIATLSDASENTNVSLSKLIIPSMPQIIKGGACISQANKIYGKENDKIVASNVSMSYDENSMVITVSYSDTNKESADKKLVAIMEAIDYSLQNTSLPAEKVSFSSLQNKSEISSSSTFANYIIFGTLIGFVVAFVSSILIKVFDNTIRSKDELEKITGSIVLSSINEYID